MSGLIAEFTVLRSDGFRLDVSLRAPAGRTAALLGPNGAGKSTAVAAIAGLVPIDAGRIILDDVTLDDPERGVHVPPEQRRIGVVFQGDLLFPHLSVVDNIAFGPRSRGRARDEAEETARSWIGRVGLTGLEERRPGELSGGQAQRAALARALAAEPDLLLLDEPLSALDVTVRTELRRLLAEHLESFAGPRILITHDPTEAFLLTDEIHVLEAGVVTQHGTPDEIRLAPRTRYAADLAGINLVHGVGRGAVVDAAGHELHVADDGLAGPVIVTIHPTAIAVHSERPAGSPRNAWATTIERVEQVGNRVRLGTGEPLRMTVEVTGAARHEMGLEPGMAVWLAVKATEIGVSPVGG